MSWSRLVPVNVSLIYCLFATCVIAHAEEMAYPARQRLLEYRVELDALRRQFGGSRRLPDVRFFLFGMGSRPKLVYKSGSLLDSSTGKMLRQWLVKSETIVPPDYCVSITTTGDSRVRIVEDDQAIWIEEEGRRKPVEHSQIPIRLPGFGEYRYPRVLRVLHQELLVNLIDGKPVPNYFAYSRPWYRDGAMVAMCLKATGNLGLIKDWVLGLTEPYDRNNGGEREADNLGQALYLISLVSDRNHSLVPRILRELPRWEVQGPGGKYIQGRSDFAAHPAYQTKWAKYRPDLPGASRPVRDTCHSRLVLGAVLDGVQRFLRQGARCERPGTVSLSRLGLRPLPRQRMRVPLVTATTRSPGNRRPASAIRGHEGHRARSLSASGWPPHTPGMRRKSSSIFLSRRSRQPLSQDSNKRTQPMKTIEWPSDSVCMRMARRFSKVRIDHVRVPATDI